MTWKKKSKTNQSNLSIFTIDIIIQIFPKDIRAKKNAREPVGIWTLLVDSTFQVDDRNASRISNLGLYIYLNFSIYTTNL